MDNTEDRGNVHPDSGGKNFTVKACGVVAPPLARAGRLVILANTALFESRLIRKLGIGPRHTPHPETF